MLLLPGKITSVLLRYSLEP